MVFSGYWESYFGYYAEPEDGGASIERTGEDRKQAVSRDQLAEREFRDLGTELRALTEGGKRVFVVLSNPAAMGYDPKRMISRWTALEVEKNREVSRVVFAPDEWIQSALAAMALRCGATVIDPVSYLCSGATYGTREDGRPVYRDDNHLRSSFAARRATYLEQVFASSASAEQ